MTILQCLAIVFVVVGHRGGISFFSEWFPIYSFHMPLWMFISGYFYKTNSEQEVGHFIAKKIKNLVIPYFVVNSIYGLISVFLTQRHIIGFGVQGNIQSFLVTPWQKGQQFGLNLAGWFVLCLFLVQVTYVCLRVIFATIKLHNEYIQGFLLLTLGIIGVALAYDGKIDGWWVTILRLFYGLPFYHVGHLYHSKLKQHDKLNTAIYVGSCFVIAFFVEVITGDNMYIGMWNLDFNHFKSVPVMAFITPIAGGMFWVRVSKIVAEHFEVGKILDFISRNTWSVMMHHQMVFFCINYCFMKLHIYFGWFSGFDIEAFRTNPWYGYPVYGNELFYLFYVVMGVAVPLLIKYMLLSVKCENKVYTFLVKCF